MKSLLGIFILFCLLLAEAFALPSLEATLFSARATSQQPSASSQAEELPRGKLVGKVVAQSDASQSYALYLPSNYSTARTWPILYAFDPSGRGHIPVERFREAAEKYGWIVVGSNNSRNGPLAPSVEAARAVWADTRARFAIDDRRLYSTGFSGGARQAVRLNQLCQNCLAGVIASGAGFPPDVQPSASFRFALYGMAGTDDFNFFEMKLLDAQLERLGYTHRLEIFDGPHSWPPVAVGTKAVEWMEIQAMREGRRARDEKLIDELWKKVLVKAAEDEAAGRIYNIYLAYHSLAKDFEGLRETNAAREKASRLRETKEVKKAQDDEVAQIRRQQYLFNQILTLEEARAGTGAPAVALQEFRSAAADLRKKSKEVEDTGERRVARRTVRQLYAFYYESAMNLRSRGEQAARVVSLLEAANEFLPDNAPLLFELACAYMDNKEKKKALATLKKSVEHGFTDVDALTKSEPLTPLRDEAAFKEILARLRQKS